MLASIVFPLISKSDDKNFVKFFESPIEALIALPPPIFLDTSP